MRSFALTIVFLTTAGCGGVEPSCQVLQDYYDDCCFTCGAGDSYCSTAFDVTEETEAVCASELRDWDLGECYCDV